MFSFKQQSTHLKTKIKQNKKNPTQFEETDQASEPDSDLAEMMELSDGEFKITMINMLKAVMKNMNNVQEQMSNVNREM